MKSGTAGMPWQQEMTKSVALCQSAGNSSTHFKIKTMKRTAFTLQYYYYYMYIILSIFYSVILIIVIYQALI